MNFQVLSQSSLLGNKPTAGATGVKATSQF